jgi:proteasome assembly chaperone (PAC2) family protein
MATYGMGGGLTSYGMGQQQEATQLLGAAAKQETERNMENARIEQQRKAGNAQLGASGGAMVGSMFGPWGTVIGGLVGGLASGAF